MGVDWGALGSLWGSTGVLWGPYGGRFGAGGRFSRERSLLTYLFNLGRGSNALEYEELSLESNEQLCSICRGHTGANAVSFRFVFVGGPVGIL